MAPPPPPSSKPSHDRAPLGKIDNNVANFLQRVDVNRQVSPVHPIFYHQTILPLSTSLSDQKDKDHPKDSPETPQHHLFDHDYIEEQREHILSPTTYPIHSDQPNPAITHIHNIQRAVIDNHTTSFNKDYDYTFFWAQFNALYALFFQIFRIPVIIAFYALSWYFAKQSTWSTEHFNMSTTPTLSTLCTTILSIFFAIWGTRVLHFLLFRCDHFQRFLFTTGPSDVPAGLYQSDDNIVLTENTPEYNTAQRDTHTNLHHPVHHPRTTPQHFQPHPLLLNGDLETLIVGSLYDDIISYNLRYVRRFVQTVIDLEWIAIDIAFPFDEFQGCYIHNPEVSIILIQHGLGGSSDASYVRSIAEAYQHKIADPKKRHTILLINARSFGNTILLGANLYTGGGIADLYSAILFANVAAGNGVKHNVVFDNVNCNDNTLQSIAEFEKDPMVLQKLQQMSQFHQNKTTTTKTKTQQEAKTQQETETLPPPITTIKEYYEQLYDYQHYAIYKQYPTLFDQLQPHKLYNPCYFSTDDTAVLNYRHHVLRWTPVQAIGLSMSGVSLANLCTTMGTYVGLYSATTCCAISHMDSYDRSVSSINWEGILFYKLRLHLLKRFEYAFSFNPEQGKNLCGSGDLRCDNYIHNLQQQQTRQKQQEGKKQEKQEKQEKHKNGQQCAITSKHKHCTKNLCTSCTLLTLRGFTREVRKYLTFPPHFQYISSPLIEQQQQEQQQQEQQHTPQLTSNNAQKVIPTAPLPPTPTPTDLFDDIPEPAVTPVEGREHLVLNDPELPQANASNTLSTTWNTLSKNNSNMSTDSNNSNNSNHSNKSNNNNNSNNSILSTTSTTSSIAPFSHPADLPQELLPYFYDTVEYNRILYLLDTRHNIITKHNSSFHSFGDDCHGGDGGDGDDSCVVHPIETIDKRAVILATTMERFDEVAVSKIAGYWLLRDFYLSSVYAASKQKLCRLSTKLFIFHPQNDPCLVISAQKWAVELLRQDHIAKHHPMQQFKYYDHVEDGKILVKQHPSQQQQHFSQQHPHPSLSPVHEQPDDAPSPTTTRHRMLHDHHNNNNSNNNTNNAHNHQRTSSRTTMAVVDTASSEDQKQHKICSRGVGGGGGGRYTIPNHCDDVYNKETVEHFNNNFSFHNELYHEEVEDVFDTTCFSSPAHKDQQQSHNHNNQPHGQRQQQQHHQQQGQHHAEEDCAYLSLPKPKRIINANYNKNMLKENTMTNNKLDEDVEAIPITTPRKTPKATTFQPIPTTKNKNKANPEIKNISIFITTHGGHLSHFPSLDNNFQYLAKLTSIFHGKVLQHYYPQEQQQQQQQQQNDQ